MCKKLLVLLLVLGFVSSASAGLVLEWEFEDNTNDTAGSNHGTLTGTATYVAGVGGGGKAISLDGATKIENLSATGLPLAQLSPNDDHAGLFTMNMWVWQNAIPVSSVEVAGGMGSFSTLRGHCYLGSYYSENWLHSMGRTDIYPQASGEWVMLTAVIDIFDNPHEGRQTLYVNDSGGQRVETGPYFGSSNDFDPIVRVGWADSNPEGDSSPYWTGLVDGFQIYDNLLSATEIEALYNSRIPEPATICLLGLGGLALLRKRS